MKCFRYQCVSECVSECVNECVWGVCSRVGSILLLGVMWLLE